MRRIPAILTLAPLSLALYMGQATAPATQPAPPATRPAGPAQGPTVYVAPEIPQPATSEDKAAAQEKAADDIVKYINAHRDELRQALETAKFNPDGPATEYLKLKALLPADLASEMDLAVPVLHQRRINALIATDLSFIGTALTEYLLQNHDSLPDHLGDLVRLVPSINVFFLPDTALPNEVKDGTPDQQAPWINMHTMFAFPGAGMRAASITPRTVVAYERPDVSPQKPRLAVLYGDGHVETVDRLEIEKTLTMR